MERAVVLCTDVIKYQAYLREEEMSEATIRKYIHDVELFYEKLSNGKNVTKDAVIEYKNILRTTYKTASVNSMLVAVNGFLKFLGLSECCVKLLKRQTDFCRNDKELTRNEYFRLVQAAKTKKDPRLPLIMETICCTGIRISELKFITVESLKKGFAVVECKGKQRSVFLPDELRKKLTVYCERKGLRSGLVFITRNGRAIDRSNIWTAMKHLAGTAKVAAQKIFPHNLRHLFALTFYRNTKDIAHLADILGHSSIETTRRYTVESAGEHRKLLRMMKLTVPDGLLTA